MARLLVSVRSVAEAEAALAGNADLIDIKEPSHGSLGRAEDAVIAAIIHFVAGRKPVSAAFGELPESQPPSPYPDLAFAKWGLAGCQRLPDWPQFLQQRQATVRCRAVWVAYADWQCAQAPSVSEVVAQACRQNGNTLLLDTHCKEPGSLRKDTRPTLLDWLSAEEVIDLCRHCRSCGVQVALAGSLGIPEILQLQEAQPTWFAVRGAACAGGQREDAILPEKVRELGQIVKRKTHPTKRLSEKGSGSPAVQHPPAADLDQ